DSNPSTRSPARNSLPPALRTGRQITARESLRSDSCIDGTPLSMASPHCGVKHRDRRGWLPGLFDLFVDRQFAASALAKRKQLNVCHVRHVRAEVASGASWPGVVARTQPCRTAAPAQA